ncbi:hypothetical protein MRX96_054171 [Rhipicephalus microplus]
MRSRPLMVEYCAGMWTNSVAGRSGLPKRRVQNWKDRSLKDDRCQRLPLKARVLSRWPLRARVRPLWSQTHRGSSRLLWLAVCPPQEGGTVPLTVPFWEPLRADALHMRSCLNFHQSPIFRPDLLDFPRFAFGMVSRPL